MKLIKTLSLLGLSALVAGCATKHYGRQPTVTEGEVALLDCQTISIEIAKTHGFLDRIKDESEFDGRSVLSFLGDFGIGNVMEKNAATESANDRLQSLENARRAKGCDSQSVAASS